MTWLIAIIVGGLVGWIASAIMKSRQGVLMDVIVGIVGAVLARWFFGSVLGIGSALAAGTLSLLGILWAVIGAVILIAIIRAIVGYTKEPGPAYHEEVRRRRDDDDLRRR